jgi:hypothetical protein
MYREPFPASGPPADWKVIDVADEAKTADEGATAAAASTEAPKEEKAGEASKEEKPAEKSEEEKPNHLREPERVFELNPVWYQNRANTNMPGMRTTFYNKKGGVWMDGAEASLI